MVKYTYVYVLQSENDPSRFYTRRTADLRERLIRHNYGKVPHTAKWKPWRIKTYIAFSNSKVRIRSRFSQKTPFELFNKMSQVSSKLAISFR